MGARVGGVLSVAAKSKSVPQRLKPECPCATYGTTEVVPFPIVLRIGVALLQAFYQIEVG
jgi:hypothetical protein